MACRPYVLQPQGNAVHVPACVEGNVNIRFRGYLRSPRKLWQGNAGVDSVNIGFRGLGGLLSNNRVC